MLSISRDFSDKKRRRKETTKNRIERKETTRYNDHEIKGIVELYSDW